MNYVITIGPSAFPLWLPLSLWFFLILATHISRKVWDEKIDGWRLATALEALGMMWTERGGVIFSGGLTLAALFALDYFF